MSFKGYCSKPSQGSRALKAAAFSSILLTLGLTGCNSSSSDTDSEEVSVSDGIFYVSSTSTATSPSGSSWDDAYSSVQDAIDAASEYGDSEVWIAAGTYTPLDEDDGDSSAYAERQQNFTMAEGVDIYGGFAGTESSRDDRDWESNQTILSGEIGDPDDLTDNSFSVVIGASDAIIDGVTISDGYATTRAADTSDDDFVDCAAAEALDVDEEDEDDMLLRILNDYCHIAGGGMQNVGTAPTVQNVIFEDNYGAKGGAVYNMVLDSWPMTTDDDGIPVENDAAFFDNVIFRRNTATARGGAINNDLMSSPNMVDVQFIANVSTDKGGALYNDAGCSPYLYNALFLYNESERGTSIVGDGSSNPVIAYATFYGNSAEDIGGNLYQGTYAAEDGGYNEMQLNYGISLGNSSGSSSSSISNWHDASVMTDDSTVIEYTDGEFIGDDDTYDEYISITDNGDDDYDVVSNGGYSDIGWSAERDSSDWETEITDLENAHSDTYITLPYDAECVDNTSSSDAATWYVDADATGSDDGSHWDNAYPELSDALDAADCYDDIYVAGASDGSTYTPAVQDDLESREAAFVLKEGQQLLGGYCSDGSTGCVTTLSGDLDGDSTASDEDAYHVLIGADEALVDGFTVEYGNADGEGYHKRGAGMINYYVSPTVSNTIFQNNTAVEGAGMANYKDASPVLSSLTFESNTAERGAAILFRDSSGSATVETDEDTEEETKDVVDLSDSSFIDNASSERGGAIFIDYGATLIFEELTFTGNTTVGSGGSIYTDDNASQYGGTTVTLSDGTFDSNSADLRGGALAMYNSNNYFYMYESDFDDDTADGVENSIDIGYGSNLILMMSDDDGDYSASTVNDDALSDSDDYIENDAVTVDDSGYITIDEMTTVSFGPGAPE